MPARSMGEVRGEDGCGSGRGGVGGHVCWVVSDWCFEESLVFNEGD
jgi:hypothetical protein